MTKLLLHFYGILVPLASLTISMFQKNPTCSFSGKKDKKVVNVPYIMELWALI